MNRSNPDSSKYPRKYVHSPDVNWSKLHFNFFKVPSTTFPKYQVPFFLSTKYRISGARALCGAAHPRGGSGDGVFQGGGGGGGGIYPEPGPLMHHNRLIAAGALVEDTRRPVGGPATVWGERHISGLNINDA